MAKRLRILLALAMAILLLGSFNASAAPISAGVPDSGITARYNRDGASGIHFIDLDSPVSGSGRITSWSIYAQMAIPGWSDNTDSRQVGLLFYRDTGSGYTVVGKSPLETIPSGGWDKKYKFTNLGSGIQVKKGDYLGFFYPFQVTYIYVYPAESIPGGVIAFDFVPIDAGGHNVRWHEPWGSSQNTELNVGDSVDYSWFYDLKFPNGRIYSINACGTLAPIPGAVLLLGSGLAGLAGLRLRFGK